VDAAIEAGGALYRYRIGSIEFDEARGELRISGQVPKLEPKPTALLHLLLQEAPQAVTHAEIIERIWRRPPDALTGNVVPNAVSKLRAAIGDSNNAYVKSVAGIGYRIDGRVERTACGRRFVSRFELTAGSAVPGREMYRLIEPLGRPGLSTANEVWLAEHTKSRDRRVFKFCSDGERLAALKREFTLYRVLRESLGESADESHFFARVIDAQFEQEPFFIECEYGGLDLLAWAGDGGKLAGLSRQERLELFLKIARAVAAAHRMGILHKDLKPSNVLVAAAGANNAADSAAARWEVRVSDFGSGRLLKPEALEQLGVTRLGLTLTQGVGSDAGSGTLLYMAPEVLVGESPTVQSDIYALGTMLYQLLVADLRKPLAPGWEQDIGDALLEADIAAATYGRLDQRLRSADTLIERLEGLEQRRQQQAAATAEAARAQTALLALARARARRPWLIAAFAGLAIGLGASGASYLTASRALDQARAEARRAQAINDFLNLDVLQSADITAAPAGIVNVAGLLGAASAKAAKRLGGEPVTEASVRLMLGQSFLGMGQVAPAIAEFRQALARLDGAVPAGDERLPLARLRLALALVNQATFDEAHALITAAQRDVAARGAAPGNELAFWFQRARFALALQQQRYDEARNHGQGLLEAVDSVYPSDLPMRLRIRRDLAELHSRLGDYPLAASVLEPALVLPFGAEAIGAVNHAKTQVQLGRLYVAIGDVQAPRILTEARETLIRVLGADSYDAGVAAGDLGGYHLAQGEHATALPLLAAAHAAAASSRGANSMPALAAAANLALAELYTGRAAEALGHLQSIRPPLAAAMGERSSYVQLLDFFAASAEIDLGRPARALVLLDTLDAAALGQAAISADWPHKLAAQKGRALLGLGRREEGLALLGPAVAGMESAGTGGWYVAPLKALLRR
jgi:eukaryotic-like serine/threonine-protein kinase